MTESTQSDEQPAIFWRDCGDNFGAAMPFGSCDAEVGTTACGFPRRPDGTCMDGHPARPGWVPPEREEADRG